VGNVHKQQTVEEWATARLLPSEPIYLPVAEVCVVLGVSRGTAHNWIRSGAMPAIQVGGHGTAYRVPASWLIDICRKGLERLPNDGHKVEAG
jgi:excisionase family DNA binding protein